MPEHLREIIYAAAIGFAALVAAGLSSRIMTIFANRMDKASFAMAHGLLRAIRLPAAMLILLVGAYAALSQFSAFHRMAGTYSYVFQVAGVMLVLLGITNAVNLALSWYSRRQTDETYESYVSLMKKLLILTIWALGLIQILSMLGVKVTAALASLGVAGLAIGLALQDTIANLFAGFYMLTDRSVRAGDYIKLESGQEGFVETVGWRNTRIRLWANNVVLIPNSKLTQSTITNMALPNPVLSVYTNCGVSYNSDLQHVENVTIDVAREVLRTHPGADTSFDPVVRFKEFGDSNINFVVVFRAVDVGAQYLLQHEFIKALHKRFKDEGIDISFPMRKLVWDGASPVGEQAKS